MSEKKPSFPDAPHQLTFEFYFEPKLKNPVSKEVVDDILHTFAVDAIGRDDYCRWLNSAGLETGTATTFLDVDVFRDALYSAGTAFGTPVGAHSILFTASSGNLAGEQFLVVDTNALDSDWRTALTDFSDVWLTAYKAAGRSLNDDGQHRWGHGRTSGDVRHAAGYERAGKEKT